MSIESVVPSNHLILCHPLLPPSIFPSIRVFSNESALPIRWPKFVSCQRNSPVPLSCGQAEFRVWPEGGVFRRHRVSVSGESRTVMLGQQLQEDKVFCFKIKFKCATQDVPCPGPGLLQTPPFLFVLLLSPPRSRARQSMSPDHGL